MASVLVRFGIAILVLGLSTANALAADFASSPEKITPILLGTSLPDASLQRIDGTATTLKQVVGGKPAILVFYRGGWCPYCNLQLSQLRLVEKDLQSLGYQAVAISPDRPEELKKTLDKDSLNYTLVSDSSANAMKAFGIAYRVDAATLTQYAKYGVDLEKSSGETHHLLPVPGVFVVDGAGIVQFSYVHPDYRVRAPTEVVLAAARAIAEDKHKLKPAH